MGCKALMGTTQGNLPREGHKVRNQIFKALAEVIWGAEGACTVTAFCWVYVGSGKGLGWREP